MKSMRFSFAVCVLASALSMSAIAGTIHTGAPEPVPTPTPEGQMSAPENGEISTPDSEDAAEDVVAGAALSLLQGVLSLL